MLIGINGTNFDNTFQSCGKFLVLGNEVFAVAAPEATGNLGENEVLIRAGEIETFQPERSKHLTQRQMDRLGKNSGRISKFSYHGA